MVGPGRQEVARHGALHVTAMVGLHASPSIDPPLVGVSHPTFIASRAVDAERYPAALAAAKEAAALREKLRNRRIMSAVTRSLPRALNEKPLDLRAEAIAVRHTPPHNSMVPASTAIINPPTLTTPEPAAITLSSDEVVLADDDFGLRQQLFQPRSQALYNAELASWRQSEVIEIDTGDCGERAPHGPGTVWPREDKEFRHESSLLVARTCETASCFEGANSDIVPQEHDVVFIYAPERPRHIVRHVWSPGQAVRTKVELRPKPVYGAQQCLPSDGFNATRDPVYTSNPVRDPLFLGR